MNFVNYLINVKAAGHVLDSGGGVRKSSQFWYKQRGKAKKECIQLLDMISAAVCFTYLHNCQLINC